MNLALNDDGITKSRDTDQVVTICLPLEVEGKNPDGNRIRFKNLVGESLERLKAQTLEPKQIERVKVTLEGLQQHEAFVKGDSNGLLITLNIDSPEESAEIQPLCYSPIPLTALNPKPLLTPTLRIRNFETTLVLCLCEKSVKVFSTCQHKLEELNLEATSTNEGMAASDVYCAVARELRSYTEAGIPILLAGTEDARQRFRNSNPDLRYFSAYLGAETCRLARGELKKEIDALLDQIQYESAERMLTELVDGPPGRKLIGLHKVAVALQSGEVETLFLNPVYMGHEVVERMARLADSMGTRVVFVKSMTAGQKAIAKTRW